MAEQEEPDAVLLDLKETDLSAGVSDRRRGFGLVESLKGLACEPLVIVYSSLPRREREAAKKLGVDATFEKCTDTHVYEAILDFVREHGSVK